MTYNVTDEQLGRLARQLADLFRRVREGTLDPQQVYIGLQHVIQGKSLGDDTYPITVDYGRSVEDGVKTGRYDWSCSDITTRNFPTPANLKGTVEVTVELIPFNRTISSDNVLRELDRRGYRPAELQELLAFGEKYPDVQRQFPVVALGSVWQDPDGGRSVPCLFGDGSGRDLGLGWIGGDWSGICRFVAVRK